MPPVLRDDHSVLLKGQVLGHVVRRARVAAGTVGAKADRGTLADGTRKHFWTAVPLQGDPDNRYYWWRPGDGTSIGTRFKTEQDAVNALVFYTLKFKGHWGEPDRPGWGKERKARWGF